MREPPRSLITSAGGDFVEKYNLYRTIQNKSEKKGECPPLFTEQPEQVADDHE